MKQTRNWIDDPITMEECRLLHVIAQGEERGNQNWEIKTEKEKMDFLLMAREAIRKHFDPSSMEFQKYMKLLEEEYQTEKKIIDNCLAGGMSPREVYSWMESFG